MIRITLDIEVRDPDAPNIKDSLWFGITNRVDELLEGSRFELVGSASDLYKEGIKARRHAFLMPEYEDRRQEPRPHG